MNGFDDLLAIVLLPTTVYAYVVALALFFLWNLVRFYSKFRGVQLGARLGRKLLEPITSEELFSQEFGNLNEEMSKNLVLGEAWREFTECLIFPLEPGKAIQNSRDPADYFNMNAVIERYFSVRYYNSVPNILTGLGILGTFIGLAAGIGVAQSGLRQDDIELMQGALGNLLGGASLAFITSIAGLFLSLLFLGIERWSLGFLYRDLQGFVRKIDGLVNRITPERILTDQLVELQGQSLQLKRFNTELAFQIASALDEKMAGRLAPAMDKLLVAVNELKAGQQSSNEETIRAMVDEFRQTMSGATGAEFDRISETLQKIDAVMSRTADQFGERERSLQESMSGLLEEIGATLTRNSRLMQTEVDSSVRTLLEAVGTSMTQLQEALAHSQASAQSVIDEASSRATREMEANMLRSTEALAQAASGIADRMGHAGAAFSEEVTKSSEGIGEDIRALREHLMAVTALVDSVSRASLSLTEASKGTESIVRRLGELEAVLRVAAEQIGRGSRLTEESVTAVRDGVAKVQVAVADLNESQRAIAGSWVEYRDRFESLDVALRDSFKELDAGVSRYTQQVSRFQGGMDDSMSRAVESLGGAIRDLEEIMEDFTEKRGGT
jgi:DNA-binding ferritin-like protein